MARSGATVIKTSPYMGSRITPENRWEFEKKQAEFFIQNYLSRTKDEDKVEDGELLQMAQAFARYQRIREEKHYKAWLKNKAGFKYKGMFNPVITERFIQSSISVKDIIENERSIQQGDNIRPESLASGEENRVNSGIPEDSIERNSETL